eukprot:GHVH01015224.1.p1 GENE.GHVH01015224.1~~GHVH01015224.1.p1  ORF type:complete len:1302 (+),score=178.94 GHVH01015224.1:343-4248(+)
MISRELGLLDPNRNPRRRCPAALGGRATSDLDEEHGRAESEEDAPMVGTWDEGVRRKEQKAELDKRNQEAKSKDQQLVIDHAANLFLPLYQNLNLSIPLISQKRDRDKLETVPVPVLYLRIMKKFIIDTTNANQLNFLTFEDLPCKSRGIKFLKNTGFHDNENLILAMGHTLNPLGASVQSCIVASGDSDPISLKPVEEEHRDASPDVISLADLRRTLNSFAIDESQRAAVDEFVLSISQRLKKKKKIHASSNELHKIENPEVPIIQMTGSDDTTIDAIEMNTKFVNQRTLIEYCVHPKSHNDFCAGVTSIATLLSSVNSRLSQNYNKKISDEDKKSDIITPKTIRQLPFCVPTIEIANLPVSSLLPRRSNEMFTKNRREKSVEEDDIISKQLLELILYKLIKKEDPPEAVDASENKQSSQLPLGNDNKSFLLNLLKSINPSRDEHRTSNTAIESRNLVDDIFASHHSDKKPANDPNENKFGSITQNLLELCETIGGPFALVSGLMSGFDDHLPTDDEIRRKFPTKLNGDMEGKKLFWNVVGDLSSSLLKTQNPSDTLLGILDILWSSSLEDCQLRDPSFSIESYKRIKKMPLKYTLPLMLILVLRAEDDIGCGLISIWCELRRYFCSKRVILKSSVSSDPISLLRLCKSLPYPHNREALPPLVPILTWSFRILPFIVSDPSSLKDPACLDPLQILTFANCMNGYFSQVEKYIELPITGLTTFIDELYQSQLKKVQKTASRNLRVPGLNQTSLTRARMEIPEALGLQESHASGPSNWVTDLSSDVHSHHKIPDVAAINPRDKLLLMYSYGCNLSSYNDKMISDQVLRSYAFNDNHATAYTSPNWVTYNCSSLNVPLSESPLDYGTAMKGPRMAVEARNEFMSNCLQDSSVPNDVDSRKFDDLIGILSEVQWDDSNVLTPGKGPSALEISQLCDEVIQSLIANHLQGVDNPKALVLDSIIFAKAMESSGAAYSFIINKKESVSSTQCIVSPFQAWLGVWWACELGIVGPGVPLVTLTSYSIPKLDDHHNYSIVPINVRGDTCLPVVMFNPAFIWPLKAISQRCIEYAAGSCTVYRGFKPIGRKDAPPSTEREIQMTSVDKKRDTWDLMRGEAGTYMGEVLHQCVANLNSENLRGSPALMYDEGTANFRLRTEFDLTYELYPVGKQLRFMKEWAEVDVIRGNLDKGIGQFYNGEVLDYIMLPFLTEWIILWFDSSLSSDRQGRNPAVQKHFQLMHKIASFSCELGFTTSSQRLLPHEQFSLSSVRLGSSIVSDFLRRFSQIDTPASGVLLRKRRSFHGIAHLF